MLSQDTGPKACTRCGFMDKKFSYFDAGDHTDVLCYTCCGELDRETMSRGERIYLYLSKSESGWKITNWLGSLVITPGSVRRGRHNMAGVRYDVWFTAAGRNWHGVQYGDNTQLLHCKALKG